MGTVTVHVNGKPYVVGCEDGQEDHVEALARQFDTQVREVGAQVGQVGELRLFLMAALLSADENAELRARLAQAQAGQTPVSSSAEVKAAQALDAAAERIERLIEKVG